MPRSFKVPEFYRSPIIRTVKQERLKSDPKKRDVSPSVLDFGPIRFKLARHFGFCFGVENAIEIAYRAIEENPGRRVFLLSEMIHNPEVNADLLSRGVRFLMRTDGTRLLDFSELSAEDVVIVPAFGTTVELQRELGSIGIDPYFYDTTCPFVEKVWKRSEQLGRDSYTVIVHGKRTHEETRATFSHSRQNAPTLIIFDTRDAHFLVDYIKGKRSTAEFVERFRLSMSAGFDPEKHLERLGVINQTTMLATETQEISNIIRQGLLEKYGPKDLKRHFADTRDTLCYATYENQTATRALIEAGADLALVLGGYNSSNTSHLVELCEERMPTYYIKDASEILDESQIQHFDMVRGEVKRSTNWIPQRRDHQPIEIAVTSGASCPDRTVDQVLSRVLEVFGNALELRSIEQALNLFSSGLARGDLRMHA